MFDKEAATPLEEWMRYLKDGIITFDTTTPGLSEAREENRKEGAAENREEGRAEERLETARRMRSDGLSME